MKDPNQIDPADYFDFRNHGTVPDGRCVYIQSGDPGDFDGKPNYVLCLHPAEETQGLN